MVSVVVGKQGVGERIMMVEWLLTEGQRLVGPQARLKRMVAGLEGHRDSFREHSSSDLSLGKFAEIAMGRPEFS